MAKQPSPAQSALGPMVIAAMEQQLPPHQRLVHDDLAVRLLPAGLRLWVRACMWGALREWSSRMVEKGAPGIWGAVLCRKRYADDRVTEAVAAGIEQVVILGAGLDTRACRLVIPAGAAAFELDVPANIRAKQRGLKRALGQVPARLSLIPVDFETEDLGAALVAHGFRAELPTMFVWEAVTQYLTEHGVRKTLRWLSLAAAGSRLIFTHVRQDFLDGANFFGAEQLHHDMTRKYKVWHFGLAPAAVAGLLREYGWVEREQMGRSEYLARYVEPSGRELAVSELERFVHAEKPASG